MQGWKERLLSQGGREVLIKAVLQVMPTFTMVCFKIPKSLWKDNESLIWKFWWGYKGDKRKTHLLGWKKLCKPKCQGGLGFKDIENFNLTMLGKQVYVNYFTIKIPFSIRSLNQNIFPIALSERRGWRRMAHTLAKYSKSKESRSVGFEVKNKRWKTCEDTWG